MSQSKMSILLEMTLFWKVAHIEYLEMGDTNTWVVHLLQMAIIHIYSLGKMTNYQYYDASLWHTHADIKPLYYTTAVTPNMF